MIISDDEFPEFVNCPGDLTVSTDPGIGSAGVSWPAPGIIDDYQLEEDDVIVRISPVVPGVTLDPHEDVVLQLNIGVYIVTYSYTDAGQQEGQCSFTVFVEGK